MADTTVRTIQAAIHIQADLTEGRQDLHPVHRVRHIVHPDLHTGHPVRHTVLHIHPIHAIPEVRAAMGIHTKREGQEADAPAAAGSLLSRCL